MFKAWTVLNTVFLATVLLTLISWFVLPDNVAIHFSGSGAPDSWTPKWFHVVMFTVLMAILYASFALAPRLLDGVPKKYISLPNSDYWLEEENLPEAVRRMSGLMYSFGIATGLMMLAVLIMIIAANLSDPVMLPLRIPRVILISYLAYTAWWLVRVFTSFRIP
jgi:uncharacterized membrane protein